MSVITQLLNKQFIRCVRRSHPFIGTIATTLAVLGGVNVAQAQTTGFQIPVAGDLILARLGFSGGSSNPSDGSVINFAGITYNYIGNPYMAVVQGVQGTYGVAYAANQFFTTAVTLTHNSPGMLSFGNLGGSLRINNDDKRALNGFGFADSYGFDYYLAQGGGVPLGFGVWPLPAWWLSAPAYDYSSYVAVNVDGTLVGGRVTGGTQLDVAGEDSNWVIEPTFRSNAGDNFLLSETQIPNNCVLRQEVRLFRNTAQLTWRVRNTDTVSHNVYLKFVVNNRPAATGKIDPTTNASVVQSPSYYYTDPDRGPTLRTQVYGTNPDGTTTRDIPTQIDVLGGRYQTDTTLTEPFHGRHLFSGFGATRPLTVFVGDSEDLFPKTTLANSGQFSPPRTGIRYDQIQDGIAVAAIYGPITVAPGATSASIITYYGNGNSTDQLDPDFTIGTEAEEAFQYNANAVNTITDTDRGNPTLATVAKQFLSPQQLNIYGSVYNRQLSEAQFDITLKDVRMSVTLPDALRFATNPSTGQQDTATKTVGDVPGDTDGRATWVAEPTGELFGTYSYQMTASVGGISPLSRTVNRSVTIPATPLYNVSANYYQMIGFPFDFDAATTNNGDITSILNGLSKPSDTNPGSQVLYKWVPDPDSVEGAGKYVKTQNIERGVAYFYRPALSRLLFLKGANPDPKSAPATAGARVQYYQKVLERGWNMISDPWVYSVPVSFLSLANIDNTDPSSDLNLVYFKDAVASGLVRGGIFFYNPALNSGAGGYDFFSDFNQELKPYQGYWVFVEDRKILRIAVPSQKQSAILPAADGTISPTRKKVVSGAMESSRAFPAVQTTNEWKAQLVAKRTGANASSSAQDGLTLFGVSAGAKDGDDTRDLPKPPALVNDYVAVRILHDVKGKSRAFAQDMKAPGGKKTWDIEVTSDKDGPVALTWPNLSRLPRTVRLTLTDKQTGRKIALRGSSSTVVNVSAGAPSRFTLTADKMATRPLAITNVRMVNEGGTRGVNGNTNYSLAFKTTADARIEVRITALGGKTINTLATGRSVTSDGETRLFWNGRAQDGSQIAAGAYQVEITAIGENDELVTSKRPVLILR